MKKYNLFTGGRFQMLVSGMLEIMTLWIGYLFIRYGISVYIIADGIIVSLLLFLPPVMYEFYLIDKSGGTSRLVFKIIVFIIPVLVLVGDALLMPIITGKEFIFRNFLLDLFVLGLLLYILQYAAFVYNTLGERAIWAFYSGKYAKPVIENKVTMFIDLKSSTTIAEKIGHSRFLSLLNDFFYMISDSISVYSGEIYKYVGDEIILLWDFSDVSDNKPVVFFDEISEIIRENKQHFVDTYGIENLDFKAGLHAGPVVVGELGKYHKEIAFIGDTLNTTARIESLCNKEGCRLIFTEDYLHLLSEPGLFKFRSIVASRLRGKEEATELYCSA